MVEEHAKILKEILEDHNWIVDICEDAERKDSEVLLEVFEEFMKKTGTNDMLSILGR